MEHMQLVQRKPDDLKNYPLNIAIYREHIDDEFVESIRKNGVKTPLMICKSSLPELNDCIVCGRRRRVAAMTCNLKTVPCLVWECDDKLELEERLILDNVRNETTIEERTRMFEELLRIESEKAARRKAASLIGASLTVTGILPSPEKIEENSKNDEKGEAAAKAAKQVGMSPKTAKQAVKAVHAADAAKASGNEAAAEEILTALNTQSVAAAARVAETVAGCTSTKPAGMTEDQQNSASITKLLGAIDGHLSKASKAAEDMFTAIDGKRNTNKSFGSRHAKFSNMLRRLGDMIDQAQHQRGAIGAAWDGTRKQVDE